MNEQLFFNVYQRCMLWQALLRLFTIYQRHTCLNEPSIFFDSLILLLLSTMDPQHLNIHHNMFN